ncbi:hypothetical protein [Candidatus Sororendozoicomonas aggregata]|uniref:hypothetical protein n=1 Tax=Candidatus Sororendozoicomonas aggregata TaxID=3073239 RepID=UPI002ED1CE45
MKPIIGSPTVPYRMYSIRGYTGNAEVIDGAYKEVIEDLEHANILGLERYNLRTQSQQIKKILSSGFILKWILTWDLNIYCVRAHSIHFQWRTGKTNVPHTIASRGESVVCAGLVKRESEKILLDNTTGHYRCEPDNLSIAITIWRNIFSEDKDICNIDIRPQFWTPK